MINAKKELILNNLLPVGKDFLQDKIKEITGSEEISKDILTLLGEADKSVDIDHILKNSVYFPEKLADEMDNIILEALYSNKQKEEENVIYNPEEVVQFYDLYAKLMFFREILDKDELEKLSNYLLNLIILSLIELVPINNLETKKIVALGNISRRLSFLLKNS